jgi:hypothetical protein
LTKTRNDLITNLGKGFFGLPKEISLFGKELKVKKNGASHIGNILKLLLKFKQPKRSSVSSCP